jgi:hypothetical protein
MFSKKEIVLAGGDPELDRKNGKNFFFEKKKQKTLAAAV